MTGGGVVSVGGVVAVVASAPSAPAAPPRPAAVKPLPASTESAARRTQRRGPVIGGLRGRAAAGSPGGRSWMSVVVASAGVRAGHDRWRAPMGFISAAKHEAVKGL